MTAGRLVGLSVAGVAVLAVGILLGMQLVPEPTPVASSVQLPSTSSPPPTTSTNADPNVFWLADRPARTTTDQDDRGPWTHGTAKVRGNTREKSLSAAGAWCGKAQLEFTLDGGFARLVAHVAIASNSPVTKPLDFYVLTDGNRVAEFQHVGNAPQPVDVALTGARTLTVGVEPPDGDTTRCPGPERIAVWAEARLVPAA